MSKKLTIMYTQKSITQINVPKKNHGQYEHNEHRGHPVFSFFHFKHKAISYSYIYLLSQTILGKTSVHYAAEKGYKDIIQLFSLHAISSVCDQDDTSAK